MKGVGILVISIFFVLICAIIYSNCNPVMKCEGFVTKGPSITGLQGSSVSPSDLASLPSAPVENIADLPLPANDPSQSKSKFQQIYALKTDMDAFNGRLMPHMVNMSDPSIQLPIMRFKGDYQRIKDEVILLAANPGLSPQISEKDIDTMGANLRFLQRTYNTLSGSQIVPVNMHDEGFTNSNPKSTPITPDQLNILNTKLLVEIARLSASGTSDPIIQARINVFSKMQQSVVNLIQRIENKNLDPSQIPINTTDYNAFLPALGNNSVGIGNLLSSNGLTSMSSLFNAYNAGDISGETLESNLVDRYAESILNGLSISVSYTSPNEMVKEVAKAIQKGSPSQAGMNLNSVRGEFEHLGSSLETDGFESSETSASTESKGSEASVSAMFDWKKRSQQICNAIGNMGLNPSDFGCIEPGSQVGTDYSWRGNARMVCNRAATHADPGLPEQIGCPSVSWKGWRN